MKTDREKTNREQFFAALVSLETTEECLAFFEDIATGKELEAFIQRYQVARRLINGDTYETIELETNARSSMVSRIKRCLNREDSGLRAVVLREMKESSSDPAATQRWRS
ncbi:YerC/YecD family TrpR-related protein [Jeotgalibacillus haloalkalitolerans]|uniref:YerC/YecD family TrpR-related protein n=1 Tax=Jeotgalibacillus haloalkalitolerans TaxID=3104292 RepID=A0ABU5KHM3_9BACL|nr:YerC/YecD family TrpR-related protein [Jeotgalibacillus sp. HH7-29]MDZ5710721.1 YerC/YecD family TrpR-related protein [Jeotgalibacillus sp. HH7-29]